MTASVIMIDVKEETRTAEILLVEDNPADVVLMKEALKRGNISNNISVAVTGDEAFDFLHKRGKYDGKADPGAGILLTRMQPLEDGENTVVIIRIYPDPVVVHAVAK